jgi:hypothetical protein
VTVYNILHVDNTLLLHNGRTEVFLPSRKPLRVSIPGNSSCRGMVKHDTIRRSAVLTQPQATSQNDTNPILGRVKKALAYCRKHTMLSRSKGRSEASSDIGLSSMSSGSSSLSRRRIHKRRPTVLDLSRDESSRSSSDPAASSYDDDKDPFITSPSWLKAECSEGETRPVNAGNSQCAGLDS